MSFFTLSRRAAQLPAVCGLILVLAAGCSRQPVAPPAKTKTGADKTNAMGASQANLTNDYASIFEDLPAQKGVDPFYPGSHRRDPVADAASPSAVRPDAVLVLKAILRASKHGEVVINDQILETGEEAPVRVPGGHVLVRCLEVGPDYVLIRVEGDTESKKLLIEQKKN